MTGKAESETSPGPAPTAGKPAKKKGATRLVEPVLIAVAALLVAHAAAAVADMRWGILPVSIAAAVLVFPLLPVAWHVWGERRLKRKLAASDGKKPPKTSRRERFTFRLLALTAAAGIGLVLWVGTSAITALRHHSTWMLPAEMRGESCEALATTYRERLEDTGALGLIAGDTLAGFGQTRLHHRCESASWTLDERRCVLRAMESEQLPDRLYAAGYLGDCGVGGRELKAPESAPSCEALGRRAANTFTMTPGEKMPASYADAVRGHVAETCEEQGWKPLTRQCLDVGWRYGRFTPCKHEGEYVELELPDPEPASAAGDESKSDDVPASKAPGVSDEAEADDPHAEPPAGPESRGAAAAGSGPESCETLTQSLRGRLELADPQGERGRLQAHMAELHYRCVAGRWSLPERRCVADAMAAKNAADGFQSLAFLKPCELDPQHNGELVRSYRPDPLPSCSELGERAAATLGRYGRQGDPQTWEESRHQWVVAFGQRVEGACARADWAPTVRACLTVGWRYMVDPVCKTESGQWVLEGLIPDDLVRTYSPTPAPPSSVD